jgi:four helix bundle protein
MNSKTYLFNFEKLTVWQDARKFTSGIYNVTDKFPDREKFGLSSQIKRSAVSMLQILQRDLDENQRRNSRGILKFHMAV